MNSHDLLHKMIQQFDLYIQGQITLDEFNRTLLHAEQVLEFEDARITPVVHSHAIFGPVVDAEFIVIPQNGMM